jgi:hypothetical protein
MGWGIGLLFHCLGAFVHAKGLAIKEKIIEREIKKAAIR